MLGTGVSWRGRIKVDWTKYGKQEWKKQLETEFELKLQREIQRQGSLPLSSPGPPARQKPEGVSYATKSHLIWLLFPATVIILFQMV